MCMCTVVMFDVVDIFDAIVLHEDLCGHISGRFGCGSCGGIRNDVDMASLCVVSDRAWLIDFEWRRRDCLCFSHVSRCC